MKTTEFTLKNDLTIKQFKQTDNNAKSKKPSKTKQPDSETNLDDDNRTDALKLQPGEPPPT